MHIRTLARLIAITIAMSGTTKLQKALVVEEIGKPLRLAQRPIPMPGPGWVLVQVAAAGSKWVTISRDSR
jgi:hypothetical protein